MQAQQAVMWNFDQPLTDDEVLACFGAGERLTRRQVALKLRRAKSPTLVTRLNALAQAGFLRVEFMTLPNGVDMWIYSLPEQNGGQKYGDDF